MGMSYYGYDQRYAAAPAYGYSMVFVDEKTGQLMQPNPQYSSWNQSGQPQYIPIGGTGSKILGKLGGQTTYTPPSVDFNKLPSQVPAGLQIYGAGQATTPTTPTTPIKPTVPTRPTGQGLQSFIQQMRERFANRGFQNPTQPTPTQPTPTQPTAPTGTGYRPQFDPTFIQQMLAQRFGNNQGTGIPTATRPVGPPTLTPGATQSYGGYQGQGGLGALRAISNPAPTAPVGGNTNASV